MLPRYTTLSLAIVPAMALWHCRNVIHDHDIVSMVMIAIVCMGAAALSSIYSLTARAIRTVHVHVWWRVVSHVIWGEPHARRLGNRAPAGAGHSRGALQSQARDSEALP